MGFNSVFIGLIYGHGAFKIFMRTNFYYGSAYALIGVLTYVLKIHYGSAYALIGVLTYVLKIHSVNRF